MTELRHPKWEERLNAFAESAATRPYKPGQWDCLLMPAAAVKAVTGKDYGRGHRGKYTTAAGAALHLKRMGFDSPLALLDSLFPQKPIGFAQRGDLVLCKTESGDNPGVCMGEFALLAGEEGPLRASIDLWLKAWAIGEQHADLPKKRKRK
jgi:hypothetical protein